VGSDDDHDDQQRDDLVASRRSSVGSSTKQIHDAGGDDKAIALLLITPTRAAMTKIRWVKSTTSQPLRPTTTMLLPAATPLMANIVGGRTLGTSIASAHGEDVGVPAATRR